LFNIEPADVKGPLTSFQSTRFAPDDFKRLVATINNTAGDGKLEASVLDSVFEMWWPRLQAQVTEIIQSHDKGGEKERRSERDILEEVLELTRMNASRQGRSPRISEGAFVEFMETLDEMMFTLGRRGLDDMSFHFMRRLDLPLRHLCMEAGVPEMYERHQMRMRDMFGPRMEKDEKSELGSADEEHPRRSER
jgi:hypothetical protein